MCTKAAHHPFPRSSTNCHSRQLPFAPTATPRRYELEYDLKDTLSLNGGGVGSELSGNNGRFGLKNELAKLNPNLIGDYTLTYNLEEGVPPLDFAWKDAKRETWPGCGQTNKDAFDIDSDTGELILTSLATDARFDDTRTHLQYEVCLPNLQLRYILRVQVTATNNKDSAETVTFFKGIKIEVLDANDIPTFEYDFPYKRVIQEKVKRET